MKQIIAMAAFVVLMASCNSNDQHATHNSESSSPVADTSKKSIPSSTVKRVGNTDIKINYHSPGVRGRTIWGGLVPYDEVWVTGAHKATTIEVDKDFKAGDKIIPAGKYALFTIPGKEAWAIIINTNWDQHLADEYAAKDDLVRISVKPQQLDQVVERLKYDIDQKGERLADIIISWEKLSVKLPIEIL